MPVQKQQFQNFCPSRFSYFKSLFQLCLIGSCDKKGNLHSAMSKKHSLLKIDLFIILIPSNSLLPPKFHSILLPVQKVGFQENACLKDRLDGSWLSSCLEISVYYPFIIYPLQCPTHQHGFPFLWSAHFQTMSHTLIPSQNLVASLEVVSSRQSCCSAINNAFITLHTGPHSLRLAETWVLYWRT